MTDMSKIKETAIHGVNMATVSPVLADFAVNNGDRSSDMDNFEPTLTRQEFQAECDINTIMAQYEKHGVVSHVNPPQMMQYLDLVSAPRDLAEALQIMNDATASFMSLPARTRKEFDNDPVKFVEFAENETNHDKLREWGILEPVKVVQEPPPVRVVIQEVNPSPEPAKPA
uniref:Internal scaffolding protein VP3 n=1 Tax=Gokushovirinae environmental samples TaxID=1478972 RepID=A0A2R3UAH1_9VIRU|nr:internal scaffolding protein VP3 [Gokushovirinae environmental samples]